jgi:spore germination protein
MKKCIYTFSFFFSLCLLSGCSSVKSILDEVALVQAVGYDLKEDGQIEGIFVIPTYRPNNETVVEKYVASANTSKGIRRKVSAMAEKPIVAGQLRIALYSEDLAKKGIIGIVDTLYRDPSIGNRMNLAIVSGDMKKFLLKDYSNRESVASYLQNLMNHNIEKETLPSQNLHLFLYRHYSDGQDPFMPIFKQEDNHIKVSGLALFKEDKYKFSIPIKKGFMFKLLLEGYKSGKYELTLPSKEDEEKKEYAVIENLNSSTNYFMEEKNSKVKFTINIKLRGQINEYSGKLNMEKGETLKLIEKQLEEEIAKQSEKLIKKFQEEEVDPIGFGKKYRSKTYNWDSKKFYEKIYKNMEVNVKANVKIIQTGIVE